MTKYKHITEYVSSSQAIDGNTENYIIFVRLNSWTFSVLVNFVIAPRANVDTQMYIKNISKGSFLNQFYTPVSAIYW